MPLTKLRTAIYTLIIVCTCAIAVFFAVQHNPLYCGLSIIAGSAFFTALFVGATAISIHNSYKPLGDIIRELSGFTTYDLGNGKSKALTPINVIIGTKSIYLFDDTNKHLVSLNMAQPVLARVQYNRLTLTSKGESITINCINHLAADEAAADIKRIQKDNNVSSTLAMINQNNDDDAKPNRFRLQHNVPKHSHGQNGRHVNTSARSSETQTAIREAKTTQTIPVIHAQLADDSFAQHSENE